jgi:LacI family transcriptional regulator
MSKRVTIQDLANELNTTTSTISRALRNHPSISKGMKEKVLALAKIKNYQVNSIAANLRSGKSKNIGIVVPRINRDFFANVISGIEEVANNEGYSVVICQTHDKYEKEKNCIEAFLRTRVEGIIISVGLETMDFNHLKRISDLNVPLIYFDRVQEGAKSISIVNDDVEGAMQGVNHLLEMGYKRIAHLGGPSHINIYRNRKQGYLNALLKNKIPIDNDIILEINLRSESGKESIEKLKSLKNPPDAIFSSSDYAALGAMNWLKENNFKIPEEIGIVGYSNEKFTSYISPSLTTIDQHSLEMGKYAAKTFFDVIKTKDKELVLTSLAINPKLIIRESSKRK